MMFRNALILDNPAKGIQYHPAGIQMFYRCAQFTKNKAHGNKRIHNTALQSMECVNDAFS